VGVAAGAAAADIKRTPSNALPFSVFIWVIKMNEIFYSIADEVFIQFPGYVRGVVMAYDVRNTKSPIDLIELLRSAETSVRDRLDKDKITQHPQISSWREAYRSFGAKPGKYRSSIEAMVRRVLSNNELPSINALVDIGNILSLRYLVPMGGHAIDVVKQDLVLRPAKGEEEFIPFGSKQIEHPNPGEIIFVEGNTVLTRRWSWRQANHTLTLPGTTAMEFNIDGLPPVSEAEVEDICQETMQLVKRFCRGQTRYKILSRQNSRIPLFE
jgi:DNA/RNA-binding domain of Phe-tRNA-synthetase-like protein